MFRSLLSSPLALAVLVTVANAAKPVVVDDAHYLACARHIASNPTDPYGFTAFWYTRPEPAMHVLAPPVVPYWLAVGINLFGDSPPLLKLWLFPFVLLLAWALRALLVRFARGTEDFALPLLMISPAVLPTVNLMLDIPAVALGLASVELFIRACLVRPHSSVAGVSDPGRDTARVAPGSLTPATEKLSSVALALLAGVIAALAMQAKYTAFVAPAAIAWYGLTHRRYALAAVAVGLSVALFAGWELWLVEKYGESHFRFHARGAARAPEGRSWLAAFLADKSQLVPPLVGQLGCLAVGVGLLAGAVLRVPRRWLVVVACAWCVGVVLVATLPKRWTVIDAPVTAATVFWQIVGYAWLAAGVGCAAVLLFRVKKGLSFRLRADAWFLVGWLVIELAAAVALTPFPAARRVIGVTLVLGLIVARAASRIQRARPQRKAPRWVLALAVSAGIAVASLDTYDAFPEKWCAERAAGAVRERPEASTAWHVGHWGFQHYCGREGMQPLVAGETLVRAGDFVVLPVYPDAEGFYRPDPGVGVNVTEPELVADLVAEFEWDDWLSAQTVPNFYGGGEPISGRDHPRLRVRVWRLRADWVMK